MGILEGFENTLVHDFWKSYLSLDCSHAICNAHIVRELTYLEDLGQSWAKELRKFLFAACCDRQSQTSWKWRKSYRGLIKQGYELKLFEPPPRKKCQRGRTAQAKRDVRWPRSSRRYQDAFEAITAAVSTPRYARIYPLASSATFQ